MALVQSATQLIVDGSGATSFDVTMTGTVSGNVLVFLAGVLDLNETWTITSVADAGNTWVTREGLCTITGQRARAVVSHAINITGGTRTVTLTLAGTSGAGGRYLTYGCLEFTPSEAEDVWDSNSEFDYTTLDVNAGPITTTNAGDTLVGVVSVIGSINLAYGSPTSWTNSYRENDSTLHQTMDAGYWSPAAVQTGYTAQWTHANSPSTPGCAVVVALKPGVPGIKVLADYLLFPKLKLANLLGGRSR